MAKLRVAFVSAVFPYPEDNGKKVALAGFLKFLMEEVGAENLTYIKLGGPRPERETPFRIVEVKLAGTRLRLLSVIWESIVLQRRSLQEGLLYTRATRVALEHLANSGAFDVVILDTVRVGQFFETQMASGRGPRWVLYMEDLFSRRYDSMLQALRKGPPVEDPLGTYATIVPGPARSLVRSPFIQTLLFRFERRLVARREVALGRVAASVCLVSAREVDLLSARVDRPVWETPPCLPVPCYRRAQDAWRSNLFVILGALNYQPNAFAVREFLEVCMPIIVREMPSARIRIIGRGASRELRALVEAWTPQCELAGFVEDISQVLNNASAMLVPVKVGSGPKLKTLQALAHGLPLITTANGVEAIAVDDGVHCLVASDLAEFPQLMRRVGDRRRNDDLSKRSRAFFVERYSKEAVYPAYRQAFLGMGTAVPPARDIGSK